MKKKKEIVWIKWVDSHGVTTWEHKDDLVPLNVSGCISAGILVEKTKEHTTIAIGETEGQYLGRLTIPNCAILSMKILHKYE